MSYPCAVCANTMIHGVTYRFPQEYDPTKPSCGKVYYPFTGAVAAMGMTPQPTLADCWTCKGTGWVEDRRRRIARRSRAGRRTGDGEKV